MSNVFAGNKRKIATGACSDLLGMIVALPLLVTTAIAEPSHGIAMHGDPKLPADFKHFPYADSNAPKGGNITYGVQGSFDSYNPFIVKGNGVRGFWDPVFGHNVIEPLMMRSRDEAFTMYGLLAEKVEVPDDRSWVEFTMNPNAKFSDGKPVRAEDVIFTVKVLAEKAWPNYRRRMAKIVKLEKIGERGVRMSFKDGSDRELPLLLALMPVFAEHATDFDTFDSNTNKPLLGSGPYVFEKADLGTSITFKRNPDYWAKDLPSKRGFDNYDTIKIDYYRDDNSLLEAFKKGLYDLRFEGNPKIWESGLDGAALSEGRIVKETAIAGTPKGMMGYAFNTRKEMFQNRDVRQALANLFDFEWANTNLFSGVYTRTGSFYQGSELSSLGVPASDREKELLGPYMDEVQQEVLDGTYAPQVSDGSGKDRKVLRASLTTLRKAGFKLQDGVMLKPDGKPFEINILLRGGTGEQRLALAYADSLSTLGIKLNLQPVDAAQYEERRKAYDFDMIQWNWTASLSPGNEQSFRWGSEAADTPGTFNYAAVKSEAVDGTIEAMLAARERVEFIDALRALDRVLISGHYVVPLYHIKEQWVARSNRITPPKNISLYGHRAATWYATGK